jgi:plasmid maintenance system antidote protein VapI
VKQAARLLGVGRPALSNFLNGNAALSPEMALRLEQSFGADRQKLLDLQAEYDKQGSTAHDKSVAVRAYVPSVVTIKARQIEEWAAANLEARNQLPVLLRTLIHSTARDLRRVDFPGYDNAERKGWDGFAETGAATPWTPDGQSGWEFGCNENPLAKANQDYAARTASVREEERADLTFVFVTPRGWPGKAAWAKRTEALGEWKAVRAFDASDLEQWLEQSVPGQVWLAERLNLPVQGYRTLDQCWRRWSLASDPALTADLFAPSIRSYRKIFRQWLDGAPERPFIIAADSKDEALAFLACLMNDEEIVSSPLRDLPVVFESPEALRRLTSASAPFIPVVYTPQTERELAPLYRRLHCIVICPRNAVDSNPRIALDLLGHDDFKKALSAMKIEGDRAERLAHESGRSPTILRRRLSPIGAVKMPAWAQNHDIARALIPMALTGAWHAGSKADCEIVSLIADRPYGEVEENITRLLPFDDPPLWSIGKYRGVASKIDALFAIAKSITQEDLESFFLAAEYVLSECDPALNLPEDDRWAAGLYGKVRDHSAALRTGICETLVLLAVHGNDLLSDRLGINLETRVLLLIRKLLSPLTLEKLLSHNRDLPNYAEAAPDEFLRLIEEDLAKSEPVVFQILKPVDHSIFGSDCPRSGLLWALEGLAWSPQTLPRVVKILAKLSTREISDNWTNKPLSSLEAVFRSWMPQTAAPLGKRIQALELLNKHFPAIGWAICTDQFEPDSRIGHNSHRPTWRNDASGAGQVTNREHYGFVRKAIELALAWPQHDEKTLGDLVERLQVMSDEHQTAVWDLIDKWAEADPAEDAKVALRERIRRFAFTRRSRQNNLSNNTRARAREAQARLAARDPVVRHRWLFAAAWVEFSYDELDDEVIDFRKRDERIQNDRIDALREIWTERGFDGLGALLADSGAPHVPGFVMSRIIKGARQRAQFVRSCIIAAEGNLKPKFEECLRGFLLGIDALAIDKIVSVVADKIGSEMLLTFFLNMPFGQHTWRRLDQQSEEFRRAYWLGVQAHWADFTTDEANELVARLLDAGRPVTAFRAIHIDWDKIETSRLQKLLLAVASTGGETPRPFMLSPHDISKALSVLGGRAGVTVDDMARLEFMYLKALDHSEHGIPNLEKQLSASPSLYMQAVAFCFKRNDGKEDPPEWRIAEPEHRSNVASATYSLLDRIRRIPGTAEDGTIKIEDLKTWLSEVRAACARHGRTQIGDQMIGQLLSKAPSDADGTLPCRPVCEALEWMASPEVARGFTVGTRNLRGAHWRGDGGDQEREIAARYLGWAQKLAYEYPYVGSLLESIADSYKHEAKSHDSDAKVRGRLPY